MKHTILFILLSAAVLLFAGCGKENPRKVYFGATVLEIRDNSILVMPDEDAEERRSSDQINVATGNLKDSKSAESLKDLRIGDSVKIGYGGYILESYPAEITDAFALQKVKTDDADKKPPVIILSEKEYGFTRKILEPTTYSWFWENGGVEADASHPLDPNLKAVPLKISEGERYTITAGRPIESITFYRWEAQSIGYMETEPVDSNVECPENTIELRPDSVYDIFVTYGEEDGISGNAYYYLITDADADADEDAENVELFVDTDAAEESGDGEDVAEITYDPSIKALIAPPAEAFGKGMKTEAFMNGDGYSKWWDYRMEKLHASNAVQPQLNDYYAQILPLLLSGEENEVASPANIYLSLSILAEVTGGETRAEIMNALGAPDIDTVRTRAAAIWNSNSIDIPLLTSLIANSLWLRDDLIYYNEETVARIAENYRASVFAGEMGSEAMNEALRKWTDDATKGRLAEFTKEMKTDPRTILELVSTLYYKAAWNEPFNKNATGEETFHGLTGDSTCEMMHTGKTGLFYTGDSFTMASLSLMEDGNMWFFLPDEGKTIADVLADPGVMEIVRPAGEEFSEDYGPMDLPKEFHEEAEKIINISIPKFDVSRKTDLEDIMRSLGINAAFDAASADFSPLTNEPEVFVSKAEHAANLSIDEEGVTGAAYTDIGLCGAGMPPEEVVDFVLDRPFLFLVTSRDGSILFAGSVCDISE